MNFDVTSAPFHLQSLKTCLFSRCFNPDFLWRPKMIVTLSEDIFNVFLIKLQNFSKRWNVHTLNHLFTSFLLNFAAADIGTVNCQLKLMYKTAVYKLVNSSTSMDTEITVWWLQKFNIHGQKRAHNVAYLVCLSIWMGTMIWHFDSNVAVNCGKFVSDRRKLVGNPAQLNKEWHVILHSCTVRTLKIAQSYIILTVWGKFEPLNAGGHCVDPKRHIVAWFRAIWAIVRQNPPRGYFSRWV